jgi:hypothetical protein
MLAFHAVALDSPIVAYVLLAYVAAIFGGVEYQLFKINELSANDVHSKPACRLSN